jgi:hypothetical protein
MRQGKAAGLPLAARKEYGPDMPRPVRLAIALLMTLFIATATAAENVFVLADFIVAQVRESVPETAEPFSGQHAKRIHMVTTMFDLGYYPPNYQLMRSAVVETLAATDKSSASADSLTFAALSAAAKAYGHNALLIDKSAPGTVVPTALEPSTRTDGAARILILPDLNLGSFESSGECSSVARLADPAGAPPARALILDLRGNTGGLVLNAACVAGLFIKKDTALFRVVMKDLAPDEFKANIAGGKVNPLPMAVLVDRRTDSGGLLLAAVLQRTGRARLIGETKESAGINGDIHMLFFVRNTSWNFKVPTGRIFLGADRPLANGVTVDVPVPGADEAEMLKAARELLGLPKTE